MIVIIIIIQAFCEFLCLPPSVFSHSCSSYFFFFFYLLILILVIINTINVQFLFFLLPLLQNGAYIINNTTPNSAILL